ncbi:Protein scd2/ral3 [Smittium mucronatum]|uniref:Protein scd2/ral3 n=1 Tax=Smittium mucronatum TaxID=133383 RepID=A0A1R0H8R4_9FUNG|nr:Protein scd2/ral3 [Smittium mucronatum]
MEPPKKVIRALKSYITPNANHICFSSGDFFHVIGREDDSDYYYVSNPIQNIKGFVPVSHFEVLETRAQKINRLSKSKPENSNDSQPSSNASHKPLKSKNSQMTLLDIINEPPDFEEDSIFSIQSSPSFVLPNPISSLQNVSLLPMPKSTPLVYIPSTPSQTSLESIKEDDKKCDSSAESHSLSSGLRAVAIFSFNAEGKGELSVLKGDFLLVLAQSTEDWFVVEKVGSRSQVGLVPVSFVSFYDPSINTVCKSNSKYLSENNLRVPSVSEWKKSRNRVSDKSAPKSLKIDLSKGHYTDRFSSSSPCETANDSSSCNSGSDSCSIEEKRVFFPTRSDSVPTVYKTQSMPDSNLLNPQVSNLKVDNFICKNGVYLFSVQFTTDDCCSDHVYRSYPQFESFYQSLVKAYPFLVGVLEPLSKINSHFSFMNDRIASNRLSELQSFVTSSVSLCPQILSSVCLYSFLDIGPFSIKISRAKSEVAKSSCMMSRACTASDVTNSNQSLPQYLKVKLIHKSDIFAIRFSPDISYQNMVARVGKKLFSDGVDSHRFTINLRLDSGSLTPIVDQRSWSDAISKYNYKLVFVIDSVN